MRGTKLLNTYNYAMHSTKNKSVFDKVFIINII